MTHQEHTRDVPSVKVLPPIVSLGLLALQLAVLPTHTAKAGPVEKKPQKSTPSPATATDPAATFALGVKYFRGEGVAKDDQRALELIRQAADQGHGEALGALGYLYSVGQILPKNDVEARRYFEISAEKGSPKAQANLGRFLVYGRGGEKDPARGIAVLEKAVAQGLPEARLTLGEVYFFGDHADHHPDYQKAYDLFIVLAESGNAQAQNMIGVILRDGNIRQRDLTAALPWFQKAALQGDRKACSNLGHLGYRSEDRATRIEALKWMLVAKDLGEQTAIVTLAGDGPSLNAEEMQLARQQADEFKKSLPQPR